MEFEIQSKKHLSSEELEKLSMYLRSHDQELVNLGVNMLENGSNPFSKYKELRYHVYLSGDPLPTPVAQKLRTTFIGKKGKLRRKFRTVKG